MFLISKRIRSVVSASAFLYLLFFAIGYHSSAYTATTRKPSNIKTAKAETENVNYKILPGDTLLVVIYDDEELSEGVERLVGEDGIISIPYVDVKVGVKGLTIEECMREIRKRLIEEELYHDPNLDVSISKFGERHVLVIGYVEEPGSIPFEDGQIMSIEEAIGKAGGFSRDKRAARNKVKLTRQEKSGRKETISVDVEAIMKGKAKPVYLEPNDIIEVTEKFL